MKKYVQPLHRSRGFTLIELAIVLGVVGVLAAGLFRLMSTGNSQTKDASTAQQHQALIAAVAGFLSDSQGQAILTGMALGATQNIPLPTSGTCAGNTPTVAITGATFTPYSTSNFCNYLPPGFYAGTTNPYNQTYTIQVLKDGTAQNIAPQTYSYAITASGATVPDVDGGRISSLIGGDGGFVYTSNVCSGTANTACGTMGAWQSTLTTQYGFAAAKAAAGSVASRSFISPGANNSYFWLARQQIPTSAPDLNFNTMSTNQYMNGANLYMYPNPAGTPSQSNGIYMNNGVISLNNSSITGNGSATNNQIFISQTAAISDSGGQAPIQVATGCSEIATPFGPADGNCLGGALNIPWGDVYVGGAITAVKVYSASDERLKTNIQHLDNELDNVMKMDPVSFSFKQGGGASMGILAQELEKVYPQLVTQHNGTKYVEYNGLVGPMLAAIQQLKHENDDLTEQLAQQKERQDRLEGALHGTPGTTP